MGEDPNDEHGSSPQREGSNNTVTAPEVDKAEYASSSNDQTRESSAESGRKVKHAYHEDWHTPIEQP